MGASRQPSGRLTTDASVKPLDNWRIKGENRGLLFPDPGQPKLVGIARLAAASRHLAKKSRVEYRELPSWSILNRCTSPRMPFRWTINPYRGCEFGCKYCYARYTHEFMGLGDGRLFEQRIYSKANAAQILREEMRRRPRGAIAIGTSTDPYQPAERRFKTTRAILEVFAELSGVSLSITTKSNLIVRDLDVLDRVRRRNVLHVNITVTTTNARVARKLEPLAPRPDLRFEAVSQLAGAGLSVGVFANPVMPLLTDSKTNLAAVANAASQAGAAYFGGGTLFLMPSAQQQFFPFLEKEFPSLLARYREHFGKQPYLRGDYAARIRDRIAEIRAKFGLAAAPEPYEPVDAEPERQLPLFPVSPS